MSQKIAYLTRNNNEGFFDYKIDKTASLWNQLRLAWYDYHYTKNQKTDGEKNSQTYVLLIDNLLKELKLDSKEEFIKLTIDDIPELKYHYGNRNEKDSNS